MQDYVVELLDAIERAVPALRALTDEESRPHAGCRQVVAA